MLAATINDLIDCPNTNNERHDEMTLTNRTEQLHRYYYLEQKDDWVDWTMSLITGLDWADIGTMTMLMMTIQTSSNQLNQQEEEMR